MDVEIDEMREKLHKAIDRLDELAKQGNKETYYRSLQVMIRNLNKPSTPAQATETFMRLKAGSSVCVQRRSNIKVQPTAIQRRQKDKTKGAKRIRAGRPYKHENAGKAKTVRRLAASIKANRTHIKNHQRK